MIVWISGIVLFLLCGCVSERYFEERVEKNKADIEKLSEKDTVVDHAWTEALAKQKLAIDRQTEAIEALAQRPHVDPEELLNRAALQTAKSIEKLSEETRGAREEILARVAAYEDVIRKAREDLALEEKNDERIATFLGSTVGGLLGPVREALDTMRVEASKQHRETERRLSAIEQAAVVARTKADQAQKTADKVEVKTDGLNTALAEGAGKMTGNQWFMLGCIALLGLAFLGYVLRAQIPKIFALLPGMKNKK